MSICRIFILNYYSTHYQYKWAIVMIWGYGILYLQFGTTLHVNKGLIKNSVIFKIVKFPLSLPSYQWSVPQGTQNPQTLYYIILVQVTVAPAPFAPPHVPESECAQWLKKKTTSASYSWSEPAPPPLECTLQQANVSLYLRACH